MDQVMRARRWRLNFCCSISLPPRIIACSATSRRCFQVYLQDLITNSHCELADKQGEALLQSAEGDNEVGELQHSVSGIQGPAARVGHVGYQGTGPSRRRMVRVRRNSH